MKRSICIVLVVLIFSALLGVGCGKNNDSSEGSKSEIRNQLDQLEGDWLLTDYTCGGASSLGMHNLMKSIFPNKKWAFTIKNGTGTYSGAVDSGTITVEANQRIRFGRKQYAYTISGNSISIMTIPSEECGNRPSVHGDLTGPLAHVYTRQGI